MTRQSEMPAPAVDARTGNRVDRLAGSLHSALLAGAVAAAAAFIAFLIAGRPVTAVLTWMTLLGMLAFSGTYIAVAVISRISGRDRRGDPGGG